MWRKLVEIWIWWSKIKSFNSVITSSSSTKVYLYYMGLIIARSMAPPVMELPSYP